MVSAGGDVQGAGDPGASRVKTRADEMEIAHLRAEEIGNIRARVLREAEERFLREVGRVTDAASFHTASSHGDHGPGGYTMAAQSVEGVGHFGNSSPGASTASATTAAATAAPSIRIFSVYFGRSLKLERVSSQPGASGDSASWS